jgi:outer membrane PBP1 activator LpoA protein
VLSIESKENPNIHAWMQLAFIASQQPNSPKHLLSALRHWQATYPNHPGNRLLPQTFETIAADLIDPPHHIALLLPLTGTLAGPGLAIKDGFLAAFNAEPPRQKTLITLYDTNRTPADTCYEQALQDGADFIIGPLTKADVARVASLEHPVPTVLLNEVRTSLGNNIYQFGLSPRLEAYQVAAAARKQGFSHALVMTPADEWGHDIANAFSSQWQDYGGETQDTITFSSLPDINQDVRRALHIDASELRERQIRQLLGHSIESTPQRRQDFDVIFLVAYPTAARQIKPLLNYYNAGNIPVFATSSIYSGTPDTSKDRDLNGIIFSDMPWVLTHQLDHKNWPEQYNSYNRLYALGLDSFALTSALNQLLLFPAIQSQNGALYLGKNQQITRIPAFAQFKEGVPDVINGE